MILLLLSCSGSSNDPLIFEVICEPEIVSYENVAEPFLQNYCTGCHSSHIEGAKRFGAPETVNLDTYSSAKQWSERSFVRSYFNGDMPPGGGIPQAEKDRFIQWALCGTQGEDIERYVSTHPPKNQSHVIDAMIENTDFGNDVLMLRRYIEMGGSDNDRIGTFIEEFYQFGENETGFFGYALYSDSETLVQEVFYNPPIPVLDFVNMEGDIETLATIWEAGTERQEWQEWSGQQTDLELSDIDPHERDENPLESVWISSTGEERGWHFSQNVILSAEWWLREDGYAYETQQFNGLFGPELREPFGLRAQDLWFELLIEKGAP